MDINPQRLGLWIVSIRTFCRWQTGSDSAVPQGSLGWDTLTHVEASVCGNVLRELGSKGNPLSHSPKVSGSVPSAKYFHTLDLFLQPMCFWSQVADEAKMFIPSRSVPRHGRAFSCKAPDVTKLGQTWHRQGNSHFLMLQTTTRLRYHPFLFCACRGWAAAMSVPPQARSHLLGPAWGTNPTLKNSQQDDMQIKGLLQSSTARDSLETF